MNSDKEKGLTKRYLMDEQVRYLYYLVKGSEEIMISHEQRIAFELLVDMAKKGTEDANQAILSLKRTPFLHPHLREMIDAFSQQPQNQSSPPEIQGNKGISLEYQVIVHATAFNKEQTASTTAQWIASIRNGSCEQCPTKEHRRNKGAA
jgi:hypothetical protein